MTKKNIFWSTFDDGVCEGVLGGDCGDFLEKRTSIEVERGVVKGAFEGFQHL